MINTQKKGSVNFLIIFTEKRDVDDALFYAKTRNGFQYALCYSYQDGSSQLPRYKMFIRFNFSVRLPNQPFNRALITTGIRSMKKIKQWLKADNSTKILELGEYYGKKKDIDEVYQEREEEKMDLEKKKITENEEKIP